MLRYQTHVTLLHSIFFCSYCPVCSVLSRVELKNNRLSNQKASALGFSAYIKLGALVDLRGLNSLKPIPPLKKKRRSPRPFLIHPKTSQLDPCRHDQVQNSSRPLPPTRTIQLLSTFGSASKALQLLPWTEKVCETFSLHLQCCMDLGSRRYHFEPRTSAWQPPHWMGRSWTWTKPIWVDEHWNFSKSTIDYWLSRLIFNTNSTT